MSKKLTHKEVKKYIESFECKGIGCRYVDLKKLKLRMCKDDI